MITCPWCGTNYLEFQSNCDNCGGSLPLPVDSMPEPEPAAIREQLPAPPLPPRQIPDKVTRRILLTDAGAIVGFVFSLLGTIFFVVGLLLTIALVTAPVGIPFAGLGLLFFAVGAGLLIWRYQHTRQIVGILRNGQAALGDITGVTQNIMVSVNNRHPWVIQYRFKVHGKSHYGKVSTLSQPDLSQRPGKPVYVLYLHDQPDQNTLYPSPYGYFGL